MPVMVQGNMVETPLERAQRLTAAAEPERQRQRKLAAYKAELAARPPYEVFRLTQGVDIDVGGDEPPKHIPFLTLLLRINRIDLYNKATGRFAAEFDLGRMSAFIVAEEPTLTDHHVYFDDIGLEDVPDSLLVPEPLGPLALPVFWWARLVFGHRLFRSYRAGKPPLLGPGACCQRHACGKPATAVNLQNDYGTVYPIFACDAHTSPHGAWMAAD